MNFPEITEVQRFTYKPGDRFIIHIPDQMDCAEARYLVEGFRAAAGLPEGTPVLVFVDGMRLEIVENPERHPEWEACKR